MGKLNLRAVLSVAVLSAAVVSAFVVNVAADAAHAVEKAVVQYLLTLRRRVGSVISRQN